MLRLFDNEHESVEQCLVIVHDSSREENPGKPDSQEDLLSFLREKNTERCEDLCTGLEALHSILEAGAPGLLALWFEKHGSGHRAEVVEAEM